MSELRGPSRECPRPSSAERYQGCQGVLRSQQRQEPRLRAELEREEPGESWEGQSQLERKENTDADFPQGKGFPRTSLSPTATWSQG